MQTVVLSFILFLPSLALTSNVVPFFTPDNIKVFSNGSNFTNILLKGEAIFVGAKDKIIKLDAVNIENANVLVNIDLPATNEQKEQCMITYYDEKLCSNYIKAILNRQNENDLYVCGTYAFTPRLFQFSYDLQLMKEDDGYGYCSLNPVDSSTAVWVEKGNPLDIGSLYSGSLLDASTKTQPVEPVIYRPELRRGDKSFQYLRTPKFDSDWLNQPKFLTSFDVDDYVLFFLREKSIEQVAEGQDMTYGRVIRLCKNDVGSLNLGNQWSSMRKTRLTCIYNKIYLDNLESVVRVNENLFVALFSLQMPNHQSASFLCEYTKDQLLSGLNVPASNFKELVPGTQYWSKLPSDKVPKNYPSQCNYNSYELRDEISNFAKTHCLIGDHIAGKLVNFLNRPVTAFAVDSIELPKEFRQGEVMDEKINVYYLGTNSGGIIKMSSLDTSSIISEWELNSNERINEIKINPGKSLFVATESSVQQVSLNQCHHYSICTTCMRDPNCGWNIRQNVCEFADSSSSLVALNENLCSRFQRQENVRNMVVEEGSSAKLECNIADSYLLKFVEWTKDSELIGFSGNLFLSDAKDLVILNGNVTESGVYKCYANTDLVVSYNLSYKPQSVHLAASVSTTSSEKCITSESYIKQYNNWCDEYSRYQRALNEWEDLKDKSCSSMSGQGTIRT